MIRAVVVLGVLLALAVVGAAVDVGAHRTWHRIACWRSGRRRVRAWNRIRRERAAADLATCNAIWNLATRRKETP